MVKDSGYSFAVGEMKAPASHSLPVTSSYRTRPGPLVLCQVWSCLRIQSQPEVTAQAAANYGGGGQAWAVSLVSWVLQAPSGSHASRLAMRLLSLCGKGQEGLCRTAFSARRRGCQAFSRKVDFPCVFWLTKFVSFISGIKLSHLLTSRIGQAQQPEACFTGWFWTPWEWELGGKYKCKNEEQGDWLIFLQWALHLYTSCLHCGKKIYYSLFLGYRVLVG